MQRIICFFVLALSLCAVALLPSAWSESRALLIGVGNYRNPNANLRGIDKDIRMMKEVAGVMGYKSSQMKVLEDSEAALSDIEEAIEDWLVRGVTKNDRVLFYFSGHGSQIPDKNGDEKDSVDEVLVPYDVDVAGRTLKNVFLDDKFGKILSRIPSGEVVVLIDACHSGTAYKSFSITKFLSTTQDDAKFFYYEGMPETKGNFAVEGDSPAGKNYVCLSACRDDEVAVPSQNGSFFTLGIYDAITKASGAGRKLTLNELKEKTEAYLGNNLSPGRMHHPRLSGNKSLADKNIIIVSRDETRKPGDIWEKLEYLANKADYEVTVRSNKNRFKVGEHLILTCRVEKSGYLNVLNVSPGDKKATVLYPNKYHRENRVTAGAEIRIPASGDRFKLGCTPPLGKSLIVVFHTKEKINGYEEGKGGFDVLFKTLSEKTFRGFEVLGADDDGGLGAGKIITDIVE